MRGLTVIEQTHSPSRRAVLRVGGIANAGSRSRNCSRRPIRRRRRAQGQRKASSSFTSGAGRGSTRRFDPKPDAPDNVRGRYGATKTKIPGVIFGEKIPKLAAMADKLTVVRCMQHTMKNHNSAGYYSLTGVPPPPTTSSLRDSIDLFPAYGSDRRQTQPGPRRAWRRSSRSRTLSRMVPSPPASMRVSSAKHTRRCSSTKTPTRLISNCRN